MKCKKRTAPTRKKVQQTARRDLSESLVCLIAFSQVQNRSNQVAFAELLAAPQMKMPMVAHAKVCAWLQERK